ncbi:hypothetical protein [Actinomadura sp. WMMB 499]|uniref:hypothetical protein n=1 Tax=Actinomadura sp. WMMB 499 TaxID=1219491 RepID=UPI0012481828|nr:hypothetical protein [Actinomadura sp. WMMB 499]QFG25434.1 hypothetical protein F7P10_34020 [Actinomadura sp. WMMB 499]
MKIRVEFTVDVDDSFFRAAWALDPEEVREKAACELAADLTETDFFEQYVNSVKWHRLGSTEIPYVIVYAGEKGRSIRDQMDIDSYGAFS